MKSDEKILAEAVRIEVDNSTGDVFIVFKAIDPKFKQEVKSKWIDDIEFRLKGKNLVKEEEE